MNQIIRIFKGECWFTDPWPISCIAVEFTNKTVACSKCGDAPGTPTLRTHNESKQY